MKKLESLKALLVAAVPFVAKDPARLAIYVDKGRVAARGNGSLSFEYRYTATLVLEGYAGDPDMLFVPVLGWIAEHEPELLDRDPQEPFTFEAEALDDDTADVSIAIELTERVRVTRDQGGVRVVHLPEPSRADAFPGVPAGTLLWQAIVQDLRAGTLAVVPEV